MLSESWPVNQRSWLPASDNAQRSRTRWTTSVGAVVLFFFSSRRRHTRSDRDWSSDVCSSDLGGFDDAEDGVVVGFGAAAGEDDFLRTGADERSHTFASSFNRRTRLLSKGMDRGRVAEVSREIGQHGVEHGGIDGGSGVVIEIDAVHTDAIRILPLLRGRIPEAGPDCCRDRTMMDNRDRRDFHSLDGTAYVRAFGSTDPGYH